MVDVAFLAGVVLVCLMSITVWMNRMHARMVRNEASLDIVATALEALLKHRKAEVNDQLRYALMQVDPDHLTQEERGDYFNALRHLDDSEEPGRL